MSNESEFEELQRANADLKRLVKRFLIDTDAIFESKTWKIGYFFARQQRRLLLLFGDRGNLVHIGPRHFHALVEANRISETDIIGGTTASAHTARGSASRNTAVAHRPAHLTPFIWENVETMPTKAMHASEYVVSDVDVVMRGLWDLTRVR